MKRLALTLVALLFAAPCALAGSSGGDALQSANRAYKEGRYQEAYDGYRQLLGTEGQDGHLLYNLGNAAFRLNRTGEAILFYERARLAIPRDADLAFNLGHAREQLRDAVPEQEGVLGAAFFWLGSLTLAEIFWCFAAINALFWGVLTLRVFTRAEWTYSVLFVLLAGWLLAGASLGMKRHQATADGRAVVVRTEVNVLAGPDAGDTVLFKLHEGTMVRVERTDAGWSLVRLPDGKRGWLRAEGVELIAAPR